MKSHRIRFLIPLVLLVLFPACGGGSGTNSNNVAVTVSPASPTVTTGGQVSLQATVTGLSSPPALTWSIVELQANGASGSQCNWLGSTPPSGPCPDGTIQGAGVPSSTSVTYLAPSGTGTFHVQVQWSSAFSPVVAKSATSAITVTP
jgi:hypothetical protein